MKKLIFILCVAVFIPSISGAAWFDGRPTSFADLAKKVQPAVVNISTTTKVKRTPFQTGPSPFGGADPFEEFRRFFEDNVPREEVRHALGSGFIINDNGTILTNNHVVGEADEIIVKLADGRKYKAGVVGRDEQSDLAVIKIKTKDLLPFVSLGDSDAAQPGDWVMAVGNPFGFEHTITVGVISAKGRVIEDPKAPITKFIQTDASINPGNSGGPLFNLNGEVVGINTMIYGMGTGIGFAIPANLAKALIPQLISEGKVTRGWLGVQIQRLTKELAESYGLEEGHGALIGNILPDSPAAKGGLQRGDIVTEFDGKKIEEPFDLQNFVSQTKVGRQVPVKVLRQKKELVLTIPIGKRENEEEVAAGPSQQQEEAKGDVLGLVVRDLTPEEKSQVGANAKGVVVLRVISDSPSEYQDIREGDLIVEVNDTAVKNVADYKNAIQNVKKGSVVRLLLGRGTMTIYIAFRV